MIFTLMILSQGERYSRLIISTDVHGINELFNSGIELEGAVLDKNNTLIAELSNLEIEKIKCLGFSYVVFIDDVSQFYLTRNEKYSNYNIIRDIKGNYPVPND